MKKVDIALLGCFHFTASAEDVFKPVTDDMLGAKRQTEIDEVVKKLIDFRPGQICVERTDADQPRVDHTYQSFLDGTYDLKADEIDQLGFKTAKALGLARITCVNHIGNFDSDSVALFARQNNQAKTLSRLSRYGSAFNTEVERKQRDLSFTDFLLFLNSAYALKKNAGIYSKYYMHIGTREHYAGPDLVTEWYKTNIYIYANIVRQVRPTDKTLLVMLGQGHIPILKSLFASNPDFNVIEIAALLR